jgi:hypothetical protein
VTPFCLQACLTAPKLLSASFKTKAITHVILLLRTSVVQGLFLYNFLSSCPTVTVTQIMWSRKPESFADYSILKHLIYSRHRLVSSACHSITFLKTPTLSLFTCQVVEEGIEYVTHTSIWIHSWLKNFGPMTCSALRVQHTSIFALCCDICQTA